MNPPDRQRILDEEHLRLLSLFHYISGGLTIAFSCMFVIHLLIFGGMAFRPDLFFNGGFPGHRPPEQIFKILFFVFALFILLGILYGIAQIVSGRFLKQKKHLVFSFAVAIPNLFFMPFGTLLGVFTLIVLSRDSVKKLYSEGDGTFTFQEG